jgi:hypothetical protein
MFFQFIPSAARDLRCTRAKRAGGVNRPAVAASPKILRCFAPQDKVSH